MNNNIIAILITTFLRDNLLYKTLQNIVDNYTNNCIILIADCGYDSEEKKINIEYIKSQIPCEYYKIPFDSGLSIARNFLINKAHELNIPYCLMMADSIQFLHCYNFKPIINFLESEDKRGLVGFDLEESKCNWEYLMELTSNGIKFSFSDKYYYFENIKLIQIDICRNIFLAKTNTLLNLYDEELKLAEHELAFLEYKKRKYKAYWTDSYVFKRIKTENTKEYIAYRNRFGNYLKIAKQKMGIKTGWVIYPK